MQAINMVKDEGELITADARQNAELLWLARGVGPGFPGVILRYHLRLHPTPRGLAQSLYVYPLDQLDAVIPWLAETVRKLPNTVEQLLMLALPPPSAAARLSGPPQRYLTLWPVAYGDTP